MSIFPSSAQLRSLLNLTETKDKLVVELAKVEGQLAALFGGKTDAPAASVKGKRGPKPKAVATKSPGKKRGPKGQTGRLIIDTLRTAGPAGISVSDISAKTGIKTRNIHVWFSTTGKGIKEIKKVGPGIYRVANKL